jgi:hypothetical protein
MGSSIVVDGAGGFERVAQNGVSFCLGQVRCEGGQGVGAGGIVVDGAGGFERIAQQCPRQVRCKGGQGLGGVGSSIVGDGVGGFERLAQNGVSEPGRVGASGRRSGGGG